MQQANRFKRIISSSILIENSPDITELEQESILLSQALKSVRDAVTISDLDGNIIFVNEAFLILYGYNQNEIIGENISVIRPASIPDELSLEIHSLTLEGGWRGEIINKRKNGETFFVELWTSIVKDSHGRHVATVGVSHDITERKKAEKELIETKERAEMMNALKSNFLSNMSHELRTPLVGILGLAQILSEELENNNFRDMALKILSSGRRLSHTLNQILDLSKIESNKHSICWEKIDVNSVISKIVNLYSGAAYKKGIKIDSMYLCENLFINGDAKMVFEIINNLVNNALKFTLIGQVIVESSVTGRDSIDWAEIKVIDSGLGIEKDKLDLIFDEFRQVSEGLGRAYEGTGLGLTMTRKFVKLLNGEIEVDSKYGFGSIFIVRFPVLSNFN